MNFDPSSTAVCITSKIIGDNLSVEELRRSPSGCNRKVPFILNCEKYLLRMLTK